MFLRKKEKKKSEETTDKKREKTKRRKREKKKLLGATGAIGVGTRGARLCCCEPSPEGCKDGKPEFWGGKAGYCELCVWGLSGIFEAASKPNEGVIGVGDGVTVGFGESKSKEGIVLVCFVVEAEFEGASKSKSNARFGRFCAGLEVTELGFDVIIPKSFPKPEFCELCELFAWFGVWLGVIGCGLNQSKVIGIGFDWKSAIGVIFNGVDDGTEGRRLGKPPKGAIGSGCFGCGFGSWISGKSSGNFNLEKSIPPEIKLKKKSFFFFIFHFGLFVCTFLFSLLFSKREPKKRNN